MLKVWMAATLLIAAVAGAGRGMADEVRVLSSGAVAAAQQEIVQQGIGGRTNFLSGHTIALKVAMPSAIIARLTAGEPADVVVAPMEAIEVLEQAGKLVADSRLAVALVGIGVAVRQGAPAVDVGSLEALRAVLLAAPSIVHPDPSQAGSVAGKAIARMFEQMGIASEVAAKTKLKQAIAGGVEMVAKGEAAIGLFNISEILPVAGVTLAGPLPKEAQSYITFEAAVVAGTSVEAAAHAYIRQITTRRAARHWEAAGMWPFRHR